MRLHLSIHRPSLPPSNILWTIPSPNTHTLAPTPAAHYNQSYQSALTLPPQPPSSPSGTTIATLLASINSTIPLEDFSPPQRTTSTTSLSRTFGLEDYVLELNGYEILHFEDVYSVLRDGDFVVIRPLSAVEVKARRGSGRWGVDAFGRRVVDGVVFGRGKASGKRAGLVSEEQGDDEEEERQNKRRRIEVDNLEEKREGRGREIVLRREFDDDDDVDEEDEIGDFGDEEDDEEEDSDLDAEIDGSELVGLRNEARSHQQMENHSARVIPNPSASAKKGVRFSGLEAGAADLSAPAVEVHDEDESDDEDFEAGSSESESADSSNGSDDEEEISGARVPTSGVPILPPESDDDSEEDEDFVDEEESDPSDEGEDEDENSESDSGTVVHLPTALPTSTDPVSSADEDSDSDDSDADSDSSSSSSSSSSSDSSDEDSEVDTPSPKITRSNPNPTTTQAQKSLNSTPKETSSKTQSNPPGSGSRATKASNLRNKKRNRLKALKNAGLLAANADFNDLEEWDQLHPEGSRGITSSLATSTLATETSTPDPAFAKMGKKAAEFEARRAKLMAALASGEGIDVRVLEEKEDRQPKKQKISQSQDPIGRGGDASFAQQQRRLLARLIAMGEKEVSISDSSSDSDSNSDSSSAPSIQSSKRPHRSISGVSQATTIVAQPTRPSPKDTGKDIDWKEYLNVTAVECEIEGIDLRPPPFPFVQYWDEEASALMHGKKWKGQTDNRKRDSLGFSGVQEMLYTEDDAEQGYVRPERPIYDGDPEEEVELDYGDDVVMADDAIDGDEVTPSRNAVSDDLPLVPADIAAYPALTEENLLVDAIVVYKQLDMSAATNWAPQVSDWRTAKIVEVLGDGAFNATLALRDREFKEREIDDETGKVVYGKFEMPDDDEEEEDDGFRELEIASLMEPKVLAPGKQPETNGFATDTNYNQDQDQDQDSNKSVEIIQEDATSQSNHPSSHRTSPSSTAGKENITEMTSPADPIEAELPAIEDNSNPHIATPRRQEISALMGEAGFRSGIDSDLAAPYDIQAPESAQRQTAATPTASTQQHDVEGITVSSPRFTGLGSSPPAFDGGFHDSEDFANSQEYHSFAVDSRLPETESESLEEEGEEGGQRETMEDSPSAQLRSEASRHEPLQPDREPETLTPPSAQPPRISQNESVESSVQQQRAPLPMTPGYPVLPVVSESQDEASQVPLSLSFSARAHRPEAEPTVNDDDNGEAMIDDPIESVASPAASHLQSSAENAQTEAGVAQGALLRDGNETDSGAKDLTIIRSSPDQRSAVSDQHEDSNAPATFENDDSDLDLPTWDSIISSTAPPAPNRRVMSTFITTRSKRSNVVGSSPAKRAESLSPPPLRSMTRRNLRERQNNNPRSISAITTQIPNLDGATDIEDPAPSVSSQPSSLPNTIPQTSSPHRQRTTRTTTALPGTQTRLKEELLSQSQPYLAHATSPARARAHSEYPIDVPPGTQVVDLTMSSSPSPVTGLGYDDVVVGFDEEEEEEEEAEEEEESEDGYEDEDEGDEEPPSHEDVLDGFSYTRGGL